MRSTLDIEVERRGGEQARREREAKNPSKTQIRTLIVYASFPSICAST